MACHRRIFQCALAVLAVCGVAVASGSTKKPAPPAPKPLPTLSAQQIFKRVSPSVMVVESLDAEGKVTVFGSGVVIAPDRVITNRHVIEDGVSFRVVHNDKKWPAKLIRVDPDHDLAELSVSGLDAPTVQVVDSSKLDVGEKVYAIGAPEGLELTISEGLISGLRDFDKSLVIQTSAAISPGSSGGGLFDAQGRLVGITTFYLKEGQSLNFALPAEWTLMLNRQSINASTAIYRNSPGFQALVWFELALSALQAEKYDVAAQAFEQAVRLKPDLVWAWNNLAVAYASLKQYDKALAAGKQAIRLKPDDESAWVGLGMTYLDLGQYDTAVSAEQEAIRLRPADWVAWNDLGAALGTVGLYEKSVHAYQNAIRLKPESADAWYGLGLAYDGLAQLDDAIARYGEAVALEPDFARAWYHLGLDAKAEGDQAEVIKVYEKLKTLDPKRADEFFKEEVLP